MDAPTLAMLRTLDRVEDAVWLAVQAAAEAYATGLRGKPLVDRHFTPGNQARYGWKPLSAEYFTAKQRGMVSHRGAKHFLEPEQMVQLDALKARHAKVRKATRPRRRATGDNGEAGDDAAFAKATRAAHRGEVTALLDKLLAWRSGSRADANAQYSNRGGRMAYTQANLPMLVLSGELRRAVTAKNATIRVDRRTGTAHITFHDLPAYALYLHEGTGRMPKRSPVEPGKDDLAQLRAIAQQSFDDAVGKARGNPATKRGRVK